MRSVLSLRLRAAPRNVVLFVTDDQGQDAGCYGNPVLKTPNLDALAADGTRFKYAYCTTASCSPSRSVILTGLFNHANGQYGLEHGYNHFRSFDNVKSLPVLLSEAGYRTARIGKFHVGPESVYRFRRGAARQPAQPGGDGRQLPRVDRSRVGSAVLPVLLHGRSASRRRVAKRLAASAEQFRQQAARRVVPGRRAGALRPGRRDRAAVSARYADLPRGAGPVLRIDLARRRRPGPPDRDSQSRPANTTTRSSFTSPTTASRFPARRRRSTSRACDCRASCAIRMRRSTASSATRW